MIGARETRIQELGRDMVGREVHYCISSLVSDLAEMEGDREDMMEMLSPTCATCEGQGYFAACEECEGTGHYPTLGESVPTGTEDCDRCEGTGKVASHCDSEDACDDCGGEGHHEAYEHWLVSDWLASRLRGVGETVVDDWHGLTVWARCTSGQAIYIDGCIERIVEEVWREELDRVEVTT